MFDATPMNPAELAAIAESAPQRGRKAAMQAQPVSPTPSALIIQGEPPVQSQPTYHAPPPEWSSGHVPLAPYDPAPNAAIVDDIVSLHRLRQGMIKAQTKLKLQGMASIRFMIQTDDDFASDEAKAKARKRADDLYREVVADPAHPLFGNVAPYLLAMEPLDTQRAIYEKALVKAAKRLPVYEWAKGVKGFGDISFATIVGGCGDIGTYKSVSAVWKRLGLAVIGGKRQGAPGLGATADDWIEHGYNRKRRSVSFVAAYRIIGANGLWRPAPGEDVHANPDLTYYQRVFADRVRYESERLELPIVTKINAKGQPKESYKKHVSMRAHRYVEKRLLKHLYIEWRRASA